MKQGVAKVKRTLQLACNDSSYHRNCADHSSASVYGTDDAIKDPSDMNNVLALPRKLRLQNLQMLG